MEQPPLALLSDAEGDVRRAHRPWWLAPTGTLQYSPGLACPAPQNYNPESASSSGPDWVCGICLAVTTILYSATS